jgi:hypothetical protein
MKVPYLFGVSSGLSNPTVAALICCIGVEPVDGMTGRFQISEEGVVAECHAQNAVRRRHTHIDKPAGSNQACKMWLRIPETRCGVLSTSSHLPRQQGAL